MTLDHHLLLKLWDKAASAPDYDKKEWGNLSNQILEANALLIRFKRCREITLE